MTAESVQFKIQKPKKRRSALIPIILVLLAAAIIILTVLVHDRAVEPKMTAETEAAGLTPGNPPAAEQEASALIEYREKLRPRTTIGEVLSNYGFSPSDIHALYQQTKPVYDLRRIRAGQQVRLYANPEGRIERLEYDLDETNYLTIEQREDTYSAVLKAHAVEVETGMICGLIEESPITSFNQLGEEDALALAFADLFGWDVDFNIDLRAGDRFKVIYEKKFLKGKFIGYGNILAAELVNRGKMYQAFYYQPPDTGKPGHYDAEGKSLEKEFRRSPIKWARITSRFSRSRLHPIHKVYRAHYGVDYGAPVGTAVQATADGTVIYAGWNGASGRMLRLRHKNAYETMYLHLRSFAAGVKVGARVKSGDIIGYVGSSGESTGPHLDYRIRLRGSYLNPLSARFAPVEPIKEEFLADYQTSIRNYRILLEDPLVLVAPGMF
jgi:murein DD-endopeptidase MepM/ murein hydrolase activator NlpD